MRQLIWVTASWVILLTSACGNDQPELPAAELPTSTARLFEGFRLITGDGGDPVEDAAILVDAGLIQAVGHTGELGLPPGAARIDLSGKTVMPALVSLHGHLGFQRGLTYDEGNYTRETAIDHLERYAYHGVGTILSLGTDAGDLVYEVKADQADGTVGGARLLTAGRGIARPNAGPGAAALRPSAIGVDTEEEARRAVRVQADSGVDVIKIWVDDRGGTVEKLSPELYHTVIDEAHLLDLPVIAHVFYADDAAALVEAGVDGFAHLPRDAEMSDELVAAVVRRDVMVMPNLGISERGTNGEPPAWLDDPLLHESVPDSVLDRAREAFTRRTPDALQRARASYDAMQRSLAALNRAGARLVLGADSGVQDHFFGYAELRELELMVDAGLTPSEAIEASTSAAADALGLDQTGRIAAGTSADFVVLDGDPLEDITNLRRIDRVLLKGAEVDREALRRRWAED